MNVYIVIMAAVIAVLVVVVVYLYCKVQKMGTDVSILKRKVELLELRTDRLGARGMSPVDAEARRTKERTQTEFVPKTLRDLTRYS